MPTPLPTPVRFPSRRNRVAGLILAGLIAAGAGILGFPSGATRAQNPAGNGGQDSTQAAITRVLDDQTAAWNRGDLDAFLDGYWRSPRVVFQSGGTRHDGFDAMRDRYRQRYQADGRAMGQLAFAELEVEPLAADAAFVRGRYNLIMPDGTHPTGLFTLIFRKFANGWKITHDHTSAADPPTPPPAPSVPSR